MRNEYRAYLQQCKEQESLYHQIALCRTACCICRRTTNYFKEEVEALAVRKETEDDDPTL